MVITSNCDFLKSVYQSVKTVIQRGYALQI